MAQATGAYPAPPEVVRRLAEAAAQLRGADDDRDSHAVLITVAAAAAVQAVVDDTCRK